MLAKKMLNCYYSLMDKSKVYCISMVLHPRHKLAYFKNAEWDLNWIETTEVLVHEELTHLYSSIQLKPTTIKPHKVSKSTDMFDQLPVLALPKPGDLDSELD
ncbi:hypothetical protein EDD16DRAFT_1722089 [Pisolithus croceorrhizus]|nr:hypothetical protein EDD16DRAFT_1722089 [Pisolithus croceorrhizus]